MYKYAHIIVSDMMLSDIQSKLDWKINRKAYLFGSIAPDINIAFPTHTFKHTINRVRKRIMHMEIRNNTKRNIIKSFNLGIVVHYICDYFCYAHNINYHKIQHMHYEKHLNNLVKLLKTSGIESRKFTEQIEIVENHVITELNNIDTTKEKMLSNITNESIDNIEYIIDILTNIHNNYLDRTKEIDKDNWFESQYKMVIDLGYSIMVSNKIMELMLIKA